MAEHKFNPHEHLMKIGRGDQAKDYLPVQHRLSWVNDLCPEITIDIVDKIIDLDRETEDEISVWNQETRRYEKTIKRANGWAYFEMRATATDKDGHTKSAVGSKSEGAASFKDFIEKAQTGAVGRALAMIGYGTQFVGDEFDEGHRIADAPVQRSGQEQQEATTDTRRSQQQTAHAASGQAERKTQQTQDEANHEGPATAQQISSLTKLYQHLERAEPEKKPANYQEAKELIAQLSQEYREARKAEKASAAR